VVQQKVEDPLLEGLFNAFIITDSTAVTSLVHRPGGGAMDSACD